MVHLRFWKKIGNNDFCLELPPYMKMYSIVDVENLKLYETPMIMDEYECVQVPTFDDFLFSIQMSRRKMLSQTEESRLCDRVMWSIFELVLEGTSKQGKVDRDPESEGDVPTLTC